MQLMSILSGGALSLMISIGHRTGLFDAMAELPPSTSADIAKHAGLNERYLPPRCSLCQSSAASRTNW